MKHTVFIISTNDRSTFTVGWCTDILKAMDFYKGLPNLTDKMIDFNKLVYLEEHSDKNSCISRFDELVGFTYEVKEVVIASVNPEFKEFIPGKNFKL